MNKKIIAGAILGVLSGAAFAQSSVTIYGLIDAGLVVERNGVTNGGKTTTKLDGGVINGSRIGFKGTEDLGGGLSAIFTIETGFTADDGKQGQSDANNNRLFGRQSFVGLTGGFGTVKAGRFYTVVDNTLGAIDPFGNGLAGRAPNLVGAYGNAALSGYEARFNNQVQYSTPSFGGLTADVQYSFGEQPADSAKSRAYGVAVNYANGPVAVRLAHQAQNNIGTKTFTYDSTPAVPLTTTVGEHNAKHTILGATYDFGVVKLHGAYVINKRSEVAGNKQYKSNDALIGVSVPFGASKVLVSYINKKDKTEGQNAGAQQLALGYTYDLSKRTTVYAAYSAIKNNNGAYYTVGAATNAGSGSQALNLGLRHAF